MGRRDLIDQFARVRRFAHYRHIGLPFEQDAEGETHLYLIVCKQNPHLCLPAHSIDAMYSIDRDTERSIGHIVNTAISQMASFGR